MLWDDVNLTYIYSVSVTSVHSSAVVSIVPGSVIVIFQLVTHTTCTYVEEYESAWFFPNAVSNIYEVVRTSKPWAGELRDIKMHSIVISVEWKCEIKCWVRCF